MAFEKSYKNYIYILPATWGWLCLSVFCQIDSIFSHPFEITMCIICVCVFFLYSVQWLVFSVSFKECVCNSSYKSIVCHLDGIEIVAGLAFCHSNHTKMAKGTLAICVKTIGKCNIVIWIILFKWFDAHAKPVSISVFSLPFNSPILHSIDVILRFLIVVVVIIVIVIGLLYYRSYSCIFV